LLETEDLSIEQVAAEVGYSDTVSFRRLFKRMVGETPAAYRRRQSVSETARTISQLPVLPEQAEVNRDPNLTRAGASSIHRVIELRE